MSAGTTLLYPPPSLFRIAQRVFDFLLWVFRPVIAQLSHLPLANANSSIIMAVEALLDGHEPRTGCSTATVTAPSSAVTLDGARSGLR